QITQSSGLGGRIQCLGGPFGEGCEDSSGHSTWRRNHLAPGHVLRDVTLREQVRIANAVEFELIAVDPVSAPSVAFDDDPGVDEPEINLVSTDMGMKHGGGKTE